MPMPVIGEAVFELEPLAGKAQVQRRGIGPDGAGRAEGANRSRALYIAIIVLK